MKDIEIVRKTLEEHKYIDDNIGRIEEKMSDMNALVLLQRERSNVAFSTQQDFGRKLADLANSLTRLTTSLQKHFSFEEMYMLKLLDNQAVADLVLEHGKINEEFEKIDALVKSSRPEGLNQKEFLDKKAEVIGDIMLVCQLIQAHALKEDKMLRDMKNDLERTG
jgi:hemerythrin